MNKTVMTVLIALAGLATAYAQTSTWSGAHAYSANWNVGANWVGGSPPAPGLSEITIVVSGTASFTPCSGFTLQVASPDLCPAELAIRPAGDGNVKLDWSTGAAGYLLQKNTSMMAPTNWIFVPDSPVVSGDRFVVTNEPVDPKAFFRLLKP